MFKFGVIFFLTLLMVLNTAFAKDISIEVMSIHKKASTEESPEQSLMLNGFRQAITTELEELKLDSALFWNKLALKKMSVNDEYVFLKTFFENANVIMPDSEKKIQPKPVNKVAVKPEITKYSGTFKASLDTEKLKSSYTELTSVVDASTLKTFYISADIEIDKSMSWEDVGVAKPQNFSGVIKESWRKLFEKEIKGFDHIEVLEKELPTKTEMFNPKSVTLKWNSLLKKVASNEETGATSFELTAQYVLQNSKSGNVLVAFDFPIQKRDLNSKNKKALSSALASLEYNLLLSQSAKIQSILATNASTSELSEVEIKLISKSGLSEIYLINDLLQKKHAGLKLTASMKSYSTDGSILLIRAEGTPESIIDSLSKDGGKLPINEQKILLFNRDDKTFAILPKQSNN